MKLKPSPIIISLLVILLIFGNAVFLSQASSLSQELRATKAMIKDQQHNKDILEFMKFFIRSVLKAERDVDFETRLKLETAVRNLHDSQILEQWQKFVNSKSEPQAQQEVENFLELLVSKITL